MASFGMLHISAAHDGFPPARAGLAVLVERVHQLFGRADLPSFGGLAFSSPGTSTLLAERIRCRRYTFGVYVVSERPASSVRSILHRQR